MHIIITNCNNIKVYYLQFSDIVCGLSQKASCLYKQVSAAADEQHDARVMPTVPYIKVDGQRDKLVTTASQLLTTCDGLVKIF